MTPYHGLSIVSHTITAVICAAIVVLVAFQLHRDRKGLLFGALMFDIAAIAALTVVMRAVGPLGVDLHPFFNWTILLTAALPGLLLTFSAEYLAAWTSTRRWLALTLFAFIALIALLVLSGELYGSVVLSPEGFLAYTPTPLGNVMIGLGEVGVLGTLHIVLEHRKHANPRLLVGIVLLCGGLVFIAIGDRRYTLEQVFYAASALALVQPVLKEQLFDPLAQRNQEIRHQAEQLEIIARVGQHANSMLSLREMLDTVVQEMRDAFGYRAVQISLADGTHIAQAPGPAPRHAATRQVIRIPLVSVSDAGAETQIGALTIDPERKAEFSASDDKVLRILANHLAIAIQNARLFDVMHIATRRAAEANRAKSRFVAILNHELRNALQTILVNSQALQIPNRYPGATLTPKVLDDARALEQDGELMLQLVNDILDMSRAESGAEALSMTAVDPVHVLRHMERSHIAALRASVSFQRGYPSTLPLIQADERALREILSNLLSNAIKFTTSGTITLGADVDNEGETLRFFVADTGVGVPDTARKDLFREFFQVEGVAQRYGGTGLGLSICKTLVERQGGRIWHEPAPGGGSVFSFTLPLSGQATPSKRAPVSEESPVFVDRPHTLPLQIVYVGAKGEQAQALDKALFEAGYCPLALDSESGWKALVDALQPFALVLVDQPAAKHPTSAEICTLALDTSGGLTWIQDVLTRLQDASTTVTN